jgi:beta-glucanase (GH16 family)
MRWVLALLVLAGCGDPGGAAPDGWRLVWSDDFEGAAGSPPNRARWTFDVGDNGWGNQELQYYTDRPANAALDGDGRLIITARRETMGSSDYTSARLTTRGLYSQTYGRFEALLKLPAGPGFWPAFWLMGANRDQVGWPSSGEIDIVEGRGNIPWRVTGAVHGPGYSGGNALIAGYQTPDRRNLTADFHLYAVEWEPGQIRFSVDGQLFQTVRADRLPSGGRWVFDHPFYVILNLSVGGNFVVPPDATSVFPQTLVADYVRLYSR